MSRAEWEMLQPELTSADIGRDAFWYWTFKGVTSATIAEWIGDLRAWVDDKLARDPIDAALEDWIEVAAGVYSLWVNLKNSGRYMTDWLRLTELAPTLERLVMEVDRAFVTSPALVLPRSFGNNTWVDTSTFIRSSTRRVSDLLQVLLQQHQQDLEDHERFVQSLPHDVPLMDRLPRQSDPTTAILVDGIKMLGETIRTLNTMARDLRGAKVPQSPAMTPETIKEFVAKGLADAFDKREVGREREPVSSKPVYKPGGWTKAEIVEHIADCTGSFSPSTFDNIRESAAVRTSPRGGKGQQRRFSIAELKKLKTAVEDGRYRNRAAICKAFDELIEKSHATIESQSNHKL
jgi:hypothetical protein